MRVACTVEEVELENDDGREVPGVRVQCGRCEHETESFGREERSILRCLALLREECELGERNFYVVEGEDV